jgi:hypothetical protein
VGSYSFRISQGHRFAPKDILTESFAELGLLRYKYDHVTPKLWVFERTVADKGDRTAVERGGNNFKGPKDFRPRCGSSQDQDLALTGVCVASSLVSGSPGRSRCGDPATGHEHAPHRP